MSAQEQIARELKELGFYPEVLQINGLGGRQAVTFDYKVETGGYKGQTYRVGVAFQEAGYPEYPPHFVWVARLPASKLPAHSICCHERVNWSAFSVPPSDFWDRLPSSEKNMKTYMNTHMSRFWNQV